MTFIEGPYRELLLTLELIILFAFMELSFYFFYKYRKNRKEGYHSIVEFDWGVIFACFGIAIFFYIFSDFYDVDRLTVVGYGYFTLAIGATIFMYHIELTKVLKTRFAFTIILGGVIIVLLILYLVDRPFVRVFAYVAVVSAMIIVLFYFLVLIKRIWNQYRLHSIGLILGIILWMLGFTATSDPAIYLFGFAIRVIGDIGILAGLLCIGLFLTTIPSLAELGWQGKVKYVILTTRTGITLYAENLREKKRELNEVLVAGALWGIQSFIQSVLSDSHLRVLSKESDVILMEYGKQMIGILIVEQELETLKVLLKKLVTQFEYLYASIVENWDGDTSIFKPATHLINELFSLKKEKGNRKKFKM